MIKLILAIILFIVALKGVVEQIQIKRMIDKCESEKLNIEEVEKVCNDAKLQSKAQSQESATGISETT